MDGRAASHTITDKIPHLRAAGKELIVISSPTGYPDRELEHYQVYPIGPVGLRFDLRHVLRRYWGKDWRYQLATSLITLGLAPGIILEKWLWPLESQWSWWWPAYRRGRKLIRQRRIDLIYSTGGAYSAHFAAAALKRTTGLSWIAEIHDPLVIPGQDPRNRQERMRAQIESLICTNADLAFWFTDQACASAQRRHPLLGNRGQVIIPGADAPQWELPRYQKRPNLIIAHFGSLSPTRHLAGIIQVLARLGERIPESVGKIELHIYGTDLDRNTRIAMTQYVDVAVRYWGRIEQNESTAKTGRQQILEQMRQADILLLHHGVEPACAEYIPSKLYEYLWMQRPVLGLIHRNPQLEQILREFGHVVVPADNLELQIAVMADFYQRWRRNGLPDNGRTSPYTSAAAVARLLKLISESHLPRPIHGVGTKEISD